MPSEIPRKESFGSATIDHFSPEIGEVVPRAINMHFSFEEALKLHFGLGQLLGRLNGYNRNTKAGRRSAKPDYILSTAAFALQPKYEGR